MADGTLGKRWNPRSEVASMRLIDEERTPCKGGQCTEPGVLACADTGKRKILKKK